MKDSARTINAVIAANLRRVMEERGVSQPELSERSGVSQRSIGYYLNPETRQPSLTDKIPSPTVGQLALVADALGVDVAEMVMKPRDLALYRKRYEKKGNPEITEPLDGRDLGGAVERLVATTLPSAKKAFAGNPSSRKK